MFTGRIRGSGGDRAGDDVVRMDRWPKMSGGESIYAQQNKASPVLERGKDYLGSPMSLLKVDADESVASYTMGNKTDEQGHESDEPRATTAMATTVRYGL